MNKVAELLRMHEVVRSVVCPHCQAGPKFPCRQTTEWHDGKKGRIGSPIPYEHAARERHVATVYPQLFNAANLNWYLEDILRRPIPRYK